MKIHALTCNSGGDCAVILHTPMPAGNNAVGKSWKNVWLAMGRNVTGLPIGNGIGQISSAEASSVQAGDVIEITGTIPVDVVGQGAGAVDVFGTALINAALAAMQTQLNYFGWTSAA